MGSMNIYNGTNKASITYSGTSDKTIDANDLVSGTNIKTVNGSSLLGSGDMPIYTGFKNHIINGGFDVWQRGIGFSTPANESWTADRWKFGTIGNISQIYKGGAVFSSGLNTLAIDGLNGNTVIELRQYIESLNCRNFTAGNKITLSFEVYTNNGFTGKNLLILIHRPQGIDNFSSLYDGVVETIALPAGTHVQKISRTFTIPNNYFTWGTRLAFVLPDGLHTGETIAFGNVQLEEGSVATPFEQRPYGLELSLCQRYYVKFMAQQNAFAFFAQGAGYGTTFARVGVPTRVTMRAIPTLGSSAASTFALEGTVSGGVNSIIGYGTTTANYLVWQVNTASNVSGALWLYANNTTSAYLDASAEL